MIDLIPGQTGRLHRRFRVKNQYILEIISQIFAFVRSEYPQGEADECPHVNDGVIAPVVLTQFMDLGVTIVTAGDTIIRPGGFNLLIFYFSELQAFFLETGLEKTTAATAAIIIGPVGLHIDEILLTHHGLDDIAQIFSNRIAECFANDLAGILNGKLNFQVLVPVGIDLQFSLPDPFGVIFINVFDDKLMLEIEFFQSCQD